MSVLLSELLSEIVEVNRNSTGDTLDNVKRVRGINRILQDLKDFADWKTVRRTKTLYYIEGISEYNLKDYVGCTCQDNDGTTSILDFKNAYDLRLVDGEKSLKYNEEAREVRERIRRENRIGEYAVDNDMLIIGYYRQLSSQVHNCDSLTDNGTWTASGDASNLTIDTVNFEEGNGSLNFDGSGTSFVVTNSTITNLDLEELKNKSQITMEVNLPTITNFSSIKVRLGSSSALYIEKTETSPAGNAELKVGWNKFAFRWASATDTGIDPTAIDYMQITLTYSSATTDTDFRIDDIRVAKEVEMELEYYTLAMVKDTAGDYQLEFNPDDVTQTDYLIDGGMRRTVLEGAKHECFEMAGGDSERDRTDSYNKYLKQRVMLMQKSGVRVRRSMKTLNFAR